jgi:hypothetical protein
VYTNGYYHQRGEVPGVAATQGKRYVCLWDLQEEEQVTEFTLGAQQTWTTNLQMLCRSHSVLFIVYYAHVFLAL